MKLENINLKLKENIYRLTGTKTGYPSIDRTHEKGVSLLKKNPMIPNISIYHGLSLMSTFFRQADAINCLDMNFTYQELLEEAKVLSKSFKSLGVKENDIITVAMPNYSQAVTAFLAANRIGATTTFLNSECTREETERYLNIFNSPLFINFNKELDYNKTIKSQTNVKHIITVRPEDLKYKKSQEIETFTYGEYLNYRDMRVLGKTYKSPFKTNFNGKQNALILFTSGSTGNPKSVVLTNENILATGTYLKNSSNIKTEVGEKTLVPVPFCYPYGFVTSTLMSLLCGRKAILAPDIGPATIDYYMSKEPNMIFGSPALLEMIRKNTSPDMDLSSISVYISGGDFLSTEHIDSGKKFFHEHNSNITICNGSGNGETSGSGTNPVGVENKPTTVGKVLTGATAIVINEEEEELKYNEEGQLCIAGKNVFKEYYQEPELTNDAKFMYKGKEYFKTGTRGKLAEDGYFTLTGRSSRFYINSTLNKVYCDHVQQIISKIDSVEDCAVVKKPEEDLLYVNTAFVVLKKGKFPTKEEEINIRSQLNNQFFDNNTGEFLQLKEYEIPANIEFIEELPRTRADKIDYNLLENLAKDKHNYKVKKR